jgi:hypothetical protein
VTLAQQFVNGTVVVMVAVGSGARDRKAALAMRAKGIGVRKIAREVGLGVGTSCG